jgi:hypothetical protein
LPRRRRGSQEPRRHRPAALGMPGQRSFWFVAPIESAPGIDRGRTAPHGGVDVSRDAARRCDVVASTQAKHYECEHQDCRRNACHGGVPFRHHDQRSQDDLPSRRCDGAVMIAMVGNHRSSALVRHLRPRQMPSSPNTSSRAATAAETLRRKSGGKLAVA